MLKPIIFLNAAMLLLLAGTVIHQKKELYGPQQIFR